MHQLINPSSKWGTPKPNVHHPIINFIIRTVVSGRISTRPTTEQAHLLTLYERIPLLLSVGLAFIFRRIISYQGTI